MADLKVTYGRGDGEAYCSQVQEGDHGLFLADEHGQVIGWIPYDKIDHVRGEKTTED